MTFLIVFVGLRSNCGVSKIRKYDRRSHFRRSSQFKITPVKRRPVSRPFPTTRSVGNFISRYNGLHRRFTGGKVQARRGDPLTSSGIRPRTRRSRIRFRPTYPVNGTRATSSKSTPLSGIRTCGCYPLSRPFLYPRFSHRQLIISPL